MAEIADVRSAVDEVNRSKVRFIYSLKLANQ